MSSVCSGKSRSVVLYKGSFPLIYGLTRPGAWLLRKHGYDVRRRLLYETDKQRRAGWRFIEHRVDITEFMVRLELACRGRTDLAADRAQRILSKTRRRRNAIGACVSWRRCGSMARISCCRSIPTSYSDCDFWSEASKLLHVGARPRRNAGASTQEQGSNLLREEDADLP